MAVLPGNANRITSNSEPGCRACLFIVDRSGNRIYPKHHISSEQDREYHRSTKLFPDPAAVEPAIYSPSSTASPATSQFRPASVRSQPARAESLLQRRPIRPARRKRLDADPSTGSSASRGDRSRPGSCPALRRTARSELTNWVVVQRSILDPWSQYDRNQLCGRRSQNGLLWPRLLSVLRCIREPRRIDRRPRSKCRITSCAGGRQLAQQQPCDYGFGTKRAKRHSRIGRVRTGSFHHSNSRKQADRSEPDPGTSNVEPAR